jgi:hypothetical protein
MAQARIHKQHGDTLNVQMCVHRAVEEHRKMIGARHPTEAPFHRACFMRSTIGSVAHQQKLCCCFLRGSTKEDDPAITLRQAAEAAMAYFYWSRN